MASQPVQSTQAGTWRRTPPNSPIIHKDDTCGQLVAGRIFFDFSNLLEWGNSIIASLRGPKAEIEPHILSILGHNANSGGLNWEGVFARNGLICIGETG